MQFKNDSASECKKIYIFLFLVLVIDQGINLIHKTGIEISNKEILKKLLDTRKQVDEYCKKYEQLKCEIDLIKISINKQHKVVVNHGQEKLLSSVNNKIAELQMKMHKLSELITDVANENKKISAKIKHSWHERLLQLVGNGICITKIKQ